MTAHDDLDRQLSSFLRDGPDELPDASFDAVRDHIEQTRQRVIVGPGRFTEMNKIVGFGLAAAAVVAAVVIGVQALGTNGTGVAPGPTATAEAPLADPTAEPTPSPIPSAATPREDVKGWPDTGENPAGTYSWNGTRCAGASCNLGYMHNGYGSGDVAITIGVRSPAPIPEASFDVVTVAGHNGIYRRIGTQREEWIVDVDDDVDDDVEGTLVAILLRAQPGTSQADLAEAHAIIDSMRTEPMDTDLGFRIVFTLTTNDWDSG
jgi:hypothetical protein